MHDDDKTKGSTHLQYFDLKINMDGLSHNQFLVDVNINKMF